MYRLAAKRSEKTNYGSIDRLQISAWN